jgi:hypothetical protein
MENIDNSPRTSARIAFAVSGRECADYARGLVGDLAHELRPGERVRSARRLRVLSMVALDRAVLIELAEGATWEEVGRALGMSAEDAASRYSETWAEWSAEESPYAPASSSEFHVGLRDDPDLPATVHALDQWFSRHAEPWEDADSPVGRSLSS